MTIRRIEAHEGAQLRDIRLRALSDTPAAFAVTVEQELAKSASDWDARCVQSACGDGGTMVVAVTEDGAWVGMAGGYRPSSADATQVELVSMWVDPAHRGQGLGRQLVDAVVGWAVETGARTVSLWVTRGNDSAQRLYEGTDFLVTGEVQALPSDPCKDEIRMIREVLPSPPQETPGR